MKELSNKQLEDRIEDLKDRAKYLPVCGADFGAWKPVYRFWMKRIENMERILNER